jgi:alpha-galactosidase
MVDDLLIAEAQWLPQYEAAVAEALQRRERGPRLPTREGYEGAARLKVKSVEEMRANRALANENAGAADKATERPAAAK